MIAIIQVDAQGSVILTLPDKHKLIAREFCLQPQIQRELATRHPGISDVYGSPAGPLTVAVHVPVFREGNFHGSLVMLLSAEAIAKEYLKDIKIGDNGYAWIMCRQGVELYCPVPGHIGHTVFENCKEFPSILAMGGEMVQGNQGETTYSYDRIRGKTLEVITKYAVYLPIPLESTFWSIVVATPDTEILSNLQYFKNHLVYTALVLFGTVFLASFLFVKAVIIIKEEEKRKRVEQALRESEAKYRLLVENAPIGIMHFDAEGTTTDINEKFREIIGAPREDIIGFNKPRQSQDEAMRQAALAALAGSIGYYEGNYVSVIGGKMTPTRAIFNPIFSPKGAVVGGVSIFEDITARKQAEEALHASLAEKVALLKEVHHRVKNNLQIVASLLRLQANRTPDQNLVHILRDTQNRVHAMALLHEVLYRSANLARVNCAAYVDDLLKYLRRSHDTAAAGITLEKNVAAIGLPLDKSLPCGLIINELVSNALKHGFPGGRGGSVTVCLGPADGQLILSVKDNGVGLPAMEMDLRKHTASLGLRLVANLVDQLEGTMTVSAQEGGGALFRVVFPIPKDTTFEDRA